MRMMTQIMSCLAGRMSSELRDLAVLVAREAGELAVRRRREGVEVAAQKSSPTDVVTAADREVEQLIRSRIAEARPDDAVLGEEGGAVSGRSGLTWVVDPIDGTTNYLYGQPSYGVSIGVVDGEPDPGRWRALAGAVLNPVTGELFAAHRDGGATLGGTPIRAAKPVPLSQALVGTGFAYDAVERARQGAIVARLLPRVRDIRRSGVASLDLCWVACGRLNAFYERGLNPWDHAAGALIAEEAGAMVFGVGRGPAGRDLVLAASPDLADALLAAIAEAP